MNRYAVFGNPARHSLSPWLHGHFARMLQRKIAYAAYAPPPDGFAAAAAAFFEGGGRGLNATAPFKKDALEFAGRAGSFARRAVAANVLAVSGGGITAYNTDGAGLAKDIVQNLGVSVLGRRVLILGAGGAARAAALSLSERGAKITVAARRKEAALELAGASGGEAADLGECGGGFGIVINTVPGGAELPSGIFAGAELAYDMNYGASALSFLGAAVGAKIRADGCGMLVEQAALSFGLWEGAVPSTSGLVGYLRGRAAALY